MPRRLDELVLARGLAPTIERAQSEIRAGNVLVNDQRMDKPSAKIGEDVAIRLHVPAARFVSRGGLKLEAALNQFTVDVGGRVCADLGASTGGFTDCLLQRGAEKVYAIDVGYGQLAWSLRTDPRVVVLERTNARLLTALPEAISLIVADLSFISLRPMLPTIRALCTARGEAVLLVKPQFEVGRSRVGKRGLVSDEDARRGALVDVVRAANEIGFSVRGTMESPVAGAQSGNREWLIHLGAPDA